MAIVKFLKRHATGQYGIYRSFFLHFVLVYFILVILLVTITPPFAVGFCIFGIAMIWGALGSVISCVGEIREPPNSQINVSMYVVCDRVRDLFLILRSSALDWLIKKSGALRVDFAHLDLPQRTKAGVPPEVGSEIPGQAAFKIG